MTCPRPCSQQPAALGLGPGPQAPAPVPSSTVFYGPSGKHALCTHQIHRDILSFHKQVMSLPVFFLRVFIFPLLMETQVHEIFHFHLQLYYEKNTSLKCRNKWQPTPTLNIRGALGSCGDCGPRWLSSVSPGTLLPGT